MWRNSEEIAERCAALKARLNRQRLQQCRQCWKREPLNERGFCSVPCEMWFEARHERTLELNRRASARRYARNREKILARRKESRKAPLVRSAVTAG